MKEINIKEFLFKKRYSFLEYVSTVVLISMYITETINFFMMLVLWISFSLLFNHFKNNEPW